MLIISSTIYGFVTLSQTNSIFLLLFNAFLLSKKKNFFIAIAALILRLRIQFFYCFYDLIFKAFFENVNEQLINDFLSAGKPLLQIKNDSDSADIKKLMDTLSGQWKVST